VWRLIGIFGLACFGFARADRLVDFALGLHPRHFFGNLLRSVGNVVGSPGSDQWRAAWRDWFYGRRRTEWNGRSTSADSLLVTVDMVGRAYDLLPDTSMLAHARS